MLPWSCQSCAVEEDQPLWQRCWARNSDHHTSEAAGSIPARDIAHLQVSLGMPLLMNMVWKYPPSPLNEHNGMILHLNCHFLYYQDTFCQSLQHTGAKILSSCFVHGFPWCSGYHICLTRRRSPVRSRTETVLSTSLTVVNLNHCRGGSWRSCVYTYMF